MAHPNHQCRLAHQGPNKGGSTSTHRPDKPVLLGLRHLADLFPDNHDLAVVAAPWCHAQGLEPPRNCTEARR